MLSIYVHIPFCLKKCKYCDFLSFCADETTIENYVEALCKEIDGSDSKFGVGDNKFGVGDNELCGESGHIEVETIFFGGGTPSVLSGALICKIVNKIKNKFNLSPNAEISLECNPGTATFEKLLEYRQAGINRLSIGLQSTKEEELKALGRIHDFRQFLDTFSQARKAGFNNINVDIMSALPAQTTSSYLKTLTKVVELQPEHISAYSLIIEENTEFWDIYGGDSSVIKEDGTYNESNELALPNEKTEREMYYLTKEVLKKSGYHQYEISNYAKDGFECRHNKVYWTGKNYIGFGIGAASYVNGIRYKNIEDINVYIKNPHTKAEAHKLSRNDKMEEFMFLGLRLTEGISKKSWQKLFGCEIESVYEKQLEKFKTQQLLEEKEDKILLTPRGVDVSNVVLAEFLLD